jgi:DNA polymerase (family 10)
LGIENLDDLKKACEDQKIRELEGFGQKTEQKILEGMDIAKESIQRVLWAEAESMVEDLCEYMKKQCDSLKEIVPAGSYRRRKETVGDLDLLVQTDDVQQVQNVFGNYPHTEEILWQGKQKMSVRLESGLQVDLRFFEKQAFGAALQYFTGSKSHNVKLRKRAKRKNLKINEYGVFQEKDDKIVAGETEEEVYQAVDLPWIFPELREDREEFHWADHHELPDLIELDDLKGDLHCHSTWTDGAGTIEEMAIAAKQRGLEYIALTDHSKRVTMVGGLDEDKLRKTWDDVDEVNERVSGIEVLKGVEVDILENGDLDLSDKILEMADWVVASLHFGQGQEEKKIMRRILNALKNPHVRVIGHPTGRMIHERKAYAVDLEAMVETAKKENKFLELNSHPRRLDLDDNGCALAKKHGVKIIISTDAHSTEGLQASRFGINQARRGGLTADDVGNTRTWKQLQKLFSSK